MAQADESTQVVTKLRAERRSLHLLAPDHLATPLLAVIDASPLPILTLDPQGTVTGWNPAAERLLGWTAQEVLGQRLPTVPSDQWDSFEALNQRVLTGESITSHEVRRLKKDGSWIDLSISLAPLVDAQGTVCGTMAVYVDITAQKQAGQLLAHQALHDPLTELPNRTLLFDRLQQAMLAARRHTAPLALLLLDLNRFKEVNDTFGHHCGDLVLQQVAKRLRAELRDSDSVARLGGDEFALILPNTDERGAMWAAHKLVSALEQPLLVEGHRVEVGASIGITLYLQAGPEVATLLRQADKAMYAAKRAHRDYAVYGAAADP